MLKKYLLINLFILSVTLVASAQSLSPAVVSSSGGSGSANGTMLSWTIGETMTQTYSGDSLLLTQGFQQGEYSITTAVDELNELGIDVSLYPNPVEQNLNVKFSEMVDNKVQMKLMNLTGKVIMSREITNPSTISRLNVSGIASGTYMLEIRIDNKRKVFKIVKH